MPPEPLQWLALWMELILDPLHYARNTGSERIRTERSIDYINRREGIIKAGFTAVHAELIILRLEWASVDDYIRFQQAT